MSETTSPIQLPAIGQSLRNRRLQKSLTIEQAAQDTKIHSKFLRALEEEKWDVFPARVYLDGFLRSYGNYLGLEGDDLIEQLRRVTGETRKPKFAGPMPAQEPEEASPSAMPARPMWYLVGGALVLLGLAFSYVKLEERRDSLDKSSQPAEASAPAAPSAPPSAPSTHDVRVTAKVPIWTRVWTDDIVKFEGVMQPGAPKSWTVQEKFRLTAGNVSFLVVTVDGQPIVPVPGGSAGELQWTKPAPATPAAAPAPTR
jgi:cytoskeletal protein RodZ